MSITELAIGFVALGIIVVAGIFLIRRVKSQVPEVEPEAESPAAPLAANASPLRRRSLVIAEPEPVFAGAQMGSGFATDIFPQVPFDPDAPGYDAAIEAWLEALLERMLDGDLTMSEYQSLLARERSAAFDRLRRITDADEPEHGDSAASEDLASEARTAVGAIDWCIDWAGQQKGTAPERE